MKCIFKHNYKTVSYASSFIRCSKCGKFKDQPLLKDNSIPFIIVMSLIYYHFAISMWLREIYRFHKRTKL